jgi:hypothetical protein
MCVIGLVQKRQDRGDEKQGQKKRSHARGHRQTNWSKFGKRLAIGECGLPRLTRTQQAGRGL